jgi:hypothetical protein
MMSERIPDTPGKLWEDTHEKTPAPVKPAKFSLAELAADYHFFNHGAIFTFGGLRFPEEDPLSDWYALQPKGTPVVREAFTTRLFSGLNTLAGRATWDHTLCAVRHEDWHSLWTFLCGTALVDRKARTYKQVFSGDIAIADPVYTERFNPLLTEIPVVTVTVFCVEGNNERWELHYETRFTPTKFVKVPPRKIIQEKAALILDGDLTVVKDRENPAMVQMMREALEGKHAR